MTIKLDYQTVKNLKSAGRYTDALIKGLHVWVKPNGKKYWIFRYNFNNKQHNISLGSFSAMTAIDPKQTYWLQRNSLTPERISIALN